MSECVCVCVCVYGGDGGGSFAHGSRSCGLCVAHCSMCAITHRVCVKVLLLRRIRKQFFNGSTSHDYSIACVGLCLTARNVKTLRQCDHT